MVPESALSDRLRSALDEAERIALAADAGGAPWSARASSSGPEVLIGEEVAWSREVDFAVWVCEDEQDGCPEIARGYRAEAAHIAANSPAVVLRTIQAHRKILDRHRPIWRDIGWLEHHAPDDIEDHIDEIRVCGHCVPRHSSFGSRAEVPDYPCDDVRDLALIYFPEGTPTNG